MATKISIAEGNWYQGGLASFLVDVEDAAGAAQNMAGWTLGAAFSNGRTVVVSKTSPSGGITIGNGVGTNDRATITVAAADTDDLPAGRYHLTVWRTDGSNDVPLASGPAILTPAVAMPAV